MIVAADMGKPVLDADLMGRAYPNVCCSISTIPSLVLMEQFSIDVSNVSECLLVSIGQRDRLQCLISIPGAFNIPGGLWPCAISDGVGNTVVSIELRHTLHSSS